MPALKQIFLLCVASALVMLVSARPDSGGNPPLPGPGLSYGGIPYGSMSGNVAEYFRQRGASGGRARSLAPEAEQIDFAPIEQWLR